MSRAETILNNLCKDTHKLIIKKLKLNLSTQHKKNRVDIILQKIQTEGVKKTLGVLKMNSLKGLVEHPALLEKNKSKKYPNKNAMILEICRIMEDVGVKNFLNDFDKDPLLKCCIDIDDLSNYTEDELNEIEKKELIKAIMTNVTYFSLIYLFSQFETDELRSVCEELKLQVSSYSRDIIIESIIENKDYDKVNNNKKKQKT